MQKYISKNNKLLVISDTGIVKTAIGYKAFGPVVKELKSLLLIFDSITWIGFLKKNESENKSYIEINDSRINIKTIKSVGGKSIFNKIEILIYYPIMFFLIFRNIFTHSKIHTRGPSNPAFITVILSVFFKKKKFWHKYAGSWIDKTSFFYDFQRKLLKILPSNSIITVNGKFSNKTTIKSFENPCIDEEDRLNGEKIVHNKKIDKLINFCFVGALNPHKGIDKIIETLSTFNFNKIGTIHIVGAGKDIQKYVNLSSKLKYSIVFHGFLPKDEIYKIYEISHYILLPSKSEGFPKVIGEAMNYGCIPIVSKVSCIDQYIKHNENGFLVWPISIEQIKRSIEEAINLENSKFKKMIKKNYSLAEKFTYSYYNSRIEREIFKKINS